MSVACKTTCIDPPSPGAVAARQAATPAPAAGLPEHARLLDSVAAFTHLRDIAALDHSLVLSLAELVAARAVALCKRSADNAGRIESIAHCVAAADGGYHVQVLDPELADPAHATLQHCLDSMQVYNGGDGHGGHRLVVPILREGRAIAALQIDGPGAPELVRPLVDGFVRIYANYTALLNESERDKLTGLYNRRTFDRHPQRLLGAPPEAVPPEQPVLERRAPAERASLWLAIIDIDHFKRINDSYGHLYGDEVILLLAQLMQSGFRQGDVSFRFGGEEFVVLLRADSETTARAVMERFRQRVAAHRFPQVVEVTVSIGLAHVGVADYPATVLDRADKALYFAKEHGRNRVEGYEQLRQAGELDASVVAGSIDLF